MFVYFTTILKVLTILRETEEPFLKIIWEGIKTLKKIYTNLRNYSSSRECSPLFISMIASLSLDSENDQDPDDDDTVEITTTKIT